MHGVPCCPGTTFVLYDKTTREAQLCTGDFSIGNYEVLGPLHTGVRVGGANGHDTDVSPDGALKAADWGGKPLHGTDATGADTYATVVNKVPRACRYLFACCKSNPALVSIDGGATEGLVVPASGSVMAPGLGIDKGATISARNANSGSNYTDLHVSVW